MPVQATTKPRLPSRAVADSEGGWRSALLLLRAEREARDLLYAPLGPASRSTRVVKGSVYQHRASGIELAYVVDGEVRVATPTEVFRLTPGKLLTIERGVFHALLGPERSLGFRIHWCHLDQTLALLSQTEWHSSQTIPYPDWHLRGRTDVETVGNAITSELATRGWDYPSAVTGLLTYLSCILIRRAERGPIVARTPRESMSLCPETPKSSRIAAALAFCDAEFRNGIGLADVANAVGCSSRYLGQLFASHLGHSLSDHLHNLRMAEARHLLTDTSRPIAAVAQAVGYSYPAHFTRAFSRAMGATPRAFRQRFRNS